MVAEYVRCSLTSKLKKNNLLWQPIKKDRLLRQSIACYEIAKRTYDFVMTHVGNPTINMTFVMLFLVGEWVITEFNIAAGIFHPFATIQQ